MCPLFSIFSTSCLGAGNANPKSVHTMALGRDFFHICWTGEVSRVNSKYSHFLTRTIQKSGQRRIPWHVRPVACGRWWISGSDYVILAAGHHLLFSSRPWNNARPVWLHYVRHCFSNPGHSYHAWCRSGSPKVCIQYMHCVKHHDSPDLRCTLCGQ